MYRGFGDIVSDLSAKAQSQVGILLQQRERLNALRGATQLLATAQEADRLLSIQKSLEKQIPSIQALSAPGASPSIADVAKASSFFLNISTQIDAIDSLQGRVETETGKSFGPMSSQTASAGTWLLLGAVGVAAFVLLSGKKRR